MKKLLILLWGVSISVNATNDNTPSFTANYTSQPVLIDGFGNEKIWQEAPWYAIDKIILGEQLNPHDFSGRFQLLWNAQYLYIHAEIQDDVLIDKYASPVDRYWDDDCLEVFIDEDASGGDHLYNFNAFAYHVGLDNQVADIGVNPDTKKPIAMLFNDHIKSVWKRQEVPPFKISWELAIKVFDDNFQVDAPSQPVQLKADKELGFMLAYCDNDGSENREHFIGSSNITPINGDKNLGYKTADVFEKLILIKKGK